MPVAAECPGKAPSVGKPLIAQIRNLRHFKLIIRSDSHAIDADKIMAELLH